MFYFWNSLGKMVMVMVMMTMAVLGFEVRPLPNDRSTA
jgi:hypothetical protein